jgi:4-hydroxybenzoate polyprenyltransferase
MVSGKRPNMLYFVFLFFASFLYYNSHKIAWFGHARMYDKRNLKYRWPAQNPAILLLCLVAAFAGTMSLASFCIDTVAKITAVAIALLIAMLYNIPIVFLPLRSRKGLKPFAIASVVVISGVIIPALHQTKFQSHNYAAFSLYLLAQLLFIAALCIAGDIRDRQEDREDKIQTFPVITGEHFSKKISTVLLLCHIFIMFLLWQIESILLNQFELFLFIDLIAVVLFWRLKEKDSYYHDD